MIKKLPFVVLALGVTTTILGLRWGVAGRYGMDLPEWDMWDAEGLHLLLPWYQHRPLLPELLTRQNEHHVVFTKLLNLGLTLANGKWDQRLECVANALLPALIAFAFLRWSLRFAGQAFTVPFAFFLAAAWGLPLAWHNVISGFHSQQFFLLGLSFAAIAWLPFAPSWSLRWWLGAFSAASVLLNMASGLFAAAIVLILFALRWLQRETTLRASLPAVVLSLALCGTGLLLRHEVDYHAILKARTLSDFLLTLVRALQWPAPGSPWFGLLLWLPWVGLTSVLMSRRGSLAARTHAWMICGLGGWVLLQLIATGYARGAGGPAPAARYIDTLVFGGVVNLSAVGWLGWQSTPGPLARRLLAVMAAAWLVVFFSGAYAATRKALTVDLRLMAEDHHDSLVHTRAYLATRDPAQLRDPIPYPGAGAFMERIDHPELSRLMPAGVRPAVPLEADSSSQGFTFHPLVPEPADPEPRFKAPKFRRTWTSSPATPAAGARVWTSRPVNLPQKSGWLVFDVVGLTGSGDAALELHDAQTGAVIAIVRPFTSAGTAWATAAVRVPNRPFVVHAREASPRPGLGFSEPVVMPTLSYAAWRLSARGEVIALGGVLAMLLATGAWAFRPFRSPSVPTGIPSRSS